MIDAEPVLVSWQPKPGWCEQREGWLHAESGHVAVNIAGRAVVLKPGEYLSIRRP